MKQVEKVEIEFQSRFAGSRTKQGFHRGDAEGGKRERFGFSRRAPRPAITVFGHPDSNIYFSKITGAIRPYSRGGIPARSSDSYQVVFSGRDSFRSAGGRIWGAKKTCPQMMVLQKAKSAKICENPLNLRIFRLSSIPGTHHRPPLACQ